jgi:alpha-ketoglutarate-dependent taurine dioxygenase
VRAAPSLSPIFSYHQGKLSCRYLRQYLELGHEVMQQPLSRVEIAALDLFDEVMHDPAIRLDMMLEPGDIQFANNYAVLHSRTAFEDDPDLSRRRKMIRLWLKMGNARALAPEFPGRNGFPAPDPATA